MKRLMTRNRTMITLVVLTAFSAQAVAPAQAATPYTLRDSAGMIDMTAGRTSPFVFEGATPELGKFKAYGEVNFAAGRTKGSLAGRGAVVVKTEKGLLVGDVMWDVAAGGDLRPSQMKISWRDSVELSDGTIVEPDWNDPEPQPLVVIAIIAILIGLLLPAVQ
jgi:hypothetical protein